MDFDFDLEQIIPVSSTTLTINSTGSLTVPIGTTGEQPGSPVDGMMRYNTTTAKFEGREAGAWANLIGAAAGLNNVVEDLTPQLGGNLDVNGFEITAAGTDAIILRATGTSDIELHSADDIQLFATSNIEFTATQIRVDGAIVSAPVGSNNDLTLTPDGTGNLVLDGVNWPQADGTLGQILETDGAGQLSFVTPGSAVTPGGSDSHVQYNNGGVFGGEANFIYDDTLKRIAIDGIDETTQVTIGGTTDLANSNNAALYIEVQDPSNLMHTGMHVFFNRQAANINGFISYEYDGNTPNIDITDEDDDPPYIHFDVIGSGTRAAPEFVNRFGGRGPVAGATTGFSWYVSGTETMTHDTLFLNILSASGAFQLNGVDVMLLSGGTAGQVLEKIDATDYNVQWATPSSGGPTFADDVFRITGSVDVTKLLAFEVDGLTTATTRTITMPDQDIDLTPSSGTFAASSTTITAGAGLTGGGDLSANRTLDVGAGSGIAVNADDVALDINSLAVATIAAGDFVPFWDITVTATNKKITFANFEGTLNHDNLAGFVTDEHVAHTGVILTAGTGMTGGGDISVSRTFNVIGGEGITANADDIELDYTVATVTAVSGDFIQISDASNAGAVRKVDAGDFLSGGGTANDAVQARRTTALTITTAFQDVTHDATDVETDAAVIEHDNVNTDDIDIKVTGTYEVSYDIDLDTSSLANGDTWDILARVRLNDGGTGIAGSHASVSIWQDNSVTGTDFIWHISCSFYANLTASDFVTLQIDGNDNAGSGGTPLTVAGQVTLKVKRLV